MKPALVYFSSATENTKFFVDRLSLPSARLPLRAKDESPLVDYPYVLFVPTYGGGQGESAVPPQVRNFFKEPLHRKLCVGIVGAGNINFGEKYAAAADVLAGKLAVPVLYRFELRGTADDLIRVETGILQNWEKLLELRGLTNE